MKRILLVCLTGLALVTLAQAGSCPDACPNVCGSEKSCCPAKKQSCRGVQLERGGSPASAYSSKGAPRIK